MDAYERNGRPWSGYDIGTEAGHGRTLLRACLALMDLSNEMKGKEMMGTLLLGYGYFLHFKAWRLWNTGSEHLGTGRQGNNLFVA